MVVASSTSPKGSIAFSKGIVTPKLAPVSSASCPGARAACGKGVGWMFREVKLETVLKLKRFFNEIPHRA